MRIRSTLRRSSGPGPPWATILAAVVLVLAFALWGGLFALREQRAGDAFDIVRWEITSLSNKWLFALGAPFRDDPPVEQALARYFALADRSGSRRGDWRTWWRPRSRDASTPYCARSESAAP